MLGVARAVATRSSVAGGTAFVEVSDTIADHGTSATIWNDTVTIPAEDGRVLLDFLAYTATLGATTDVIDPGGGEQALLTQPAASPQTFTTSAESVRLFYLLDASFPTGPTETLRFTPEGTEAGERQIIILSGARQTLSIDGANHDSSSALTLSVARSGGGNFATGSKVYVWMQAESTASYAVSGHATESRDLIAENGTDRTVYGKGTLGAGVTTASVVLTMDVPAVVRKAGIIVVVEPV